MMELECGDVDVLDFDKLLDEEISGEVRVGGGGSNGELLELMVSFEWSKSLENLEL